MLKKLIGCVITLSSEGEKRRRRAKVEFSAVSIPEPILAEIDDLIEELGYWPSRSAFVREACMEKIERERRRLEEKKKSVEE